LKNQITMYGIKNCDTIKKAKRYLDEQQIDYRFHDYRGDGLEQTQLAEFVEHLGHQAMLNTRGTTWRKLSEDEKQNALAKPQAAMQLMLSQPAVIKRPLLVCHHHMLLGFSPESYAQFINEVQ
jgi:Spx/MgsR family transcriptional regulator